ncbi:MAG: DUF45 domain-containing protein [Clostridia bacterium]|nr:DUF45 domain-containing protein [Clostridia bacterium]
MIKLLNKKTNLEKELCKTTKILGENYSVQIVYKKMNNPELDLNGKEITVYLPNKYKRNNNIDIIKLALEKMYDEIARIEIENVMEETRVMLHGLAPENYIIKRISNKLAKTLKDKTIVINPEIVKYNKEVLRYVVLYEFCHLKYKTNSKKFWQMIEEYMPFYEEYEYITEVA